MKIESREHAFGQHAKVEPFDDMIRIDAYAEPAKSSVISRSWYAVSWPNIGAVDTKTARQFAQAIIMACDWVDEQEEIDAKT